LICPLFVNARESKEKSDQAADDQDKEKNEPRGAK
jgi:hypothetical protein